MTANKDGMAQRFAQHLMVESLRRKSDAEFIGFVAASMRDSGGPLAEYVAQRLNVIALVLEAEDAGRGA